ncbi:alpha/beta hydrolase [Paenarthrobacter ilicis]|uniref:Acetyl esterase/lipase n=1 Tax=Paenarthrobacter ilicis TaxID=43665 RepID=A0ABX0TNS1_9MICC|nr:alpha/beta hydrolase [Paenarthrobacter ilicis]MBM7791498.1 acetyl esterase/lipase [Paenarthrobacter ilicis]NIJ02766.1 acetyl esterase/lipase [Paenarthrobacter ilicis]
MLRHKYSYGEHPSQWGELFIPEPGNGNHRGATASGGVAVVIHGGYWRSQYGAELGEPLARDLAAHGITAWNLEYRRAGNGGGWPHTFEDILAGIDHLSTIAGDHDLQLGKVVALGHSAGGHLAVWAAGRQRLSAIGTPDADRQLVRSAEDDAVHLTGVVSQSGVLNLAAAEKLNLSNGAVCNLMGGDSGRFPKRHKYADPMSLLPINVPVYAVHATEDEDVPASQSEAYVAAATAAGTPAQLLRVPGDHFDLIDPKAVAYKKCRELVQRLLS